MFFLKADELNPLTLPPIFEDVNPPTMVLALPWLTEAHPGRTSRIATSCDPSKPFVRDRHNGPALLSTAVR